MMKMSTSKRLTKLLASSFRIVMIIMVSYIGQIKAGPTKRPLPTWTKKVTDYTDSI